GPAAVGGTRPFTTEPADMPATRLSPKSRASSSSFVQLYESGACRGEHRLELAVSAKFDEQLAHMVANGVRAEPQFSCNRSAALTGGHRSENVNLSGGQRTLAHCHVRHVAASDTDDRFLSRGYSSNHAFERFQAGGLADHPKAACGQRVTKHPFA